MGKNGTTQIMARGRGEGVERSREKGRRRKTERSPGKNDKVLYVSFFAAVPKAGVHPKDELFVPVVVSDCQVIMFKHSQ